MKAFSIKLKALKKAYQRQCEDKGSKKIPPSPIDPTGGRNTGALTAYWMISGTAEDMPNYKSCLSGSFTINFDESGNAVDGRMEKDCAVVVVTFDPNVVEGKTVERVEECPPASDPAFFAQPKNIKADASSGWISADLYDKKGRDMGALTGAFWRTGNSPPYSYGGKGKRISKGATFAWQSDPPLRCK